MICLRNSGLYNNSEFSTLRHNSLILTYDLIAGILIYWILESAKFIPQDDYEKYFNPKGIKFIH